MEAAGAGAGRQVVDHLDQVIGDVVLPGRGLYSHSPRRVVMRGARQRPAEDPGRPQETDSARARRLGC